MRAKLDFPIAMEGVAKLHADLARRQHAFVELTQSCAGLDGAARHRVLVDGQWRYLKAQLTDHGSTLDEATVESLLRLDVEINAQGLGVWLDRGRQTV